LHSMSMMYAPLSFVSEKIILSAPPDVMMGAYYA
jgi:hypothetical protein